MPGSLCICISLLKFLKVAHLRGYWVLFTQNNSVEIPFTMLMKHYPSCLWTCRSWGLLCDLQACSQSNLVKICLETLTIAVWVLIYLRMCACTCQGWRFYSWYGCGNCWLWSKGESWSLLSLCVLKVAVCNTTLKQPVGVSSVWVSSDSCLTAHLAFRRTSMAYMHVQCTCTCLSLFYIHVHVHHTHVIMCTYLKFVDVNSFLSTFVGCVGGWEKRQKTDGISCQAPTVQRAL